MTRQNGTRVAAMVFGSLTVVLWASKPVSRGNEIFPSLTMRNNVRMLHRGVHMCASIVHGNVGLCMHVEQEMNTRQ